MYIYIILYKRYIFYNILYIILLLYTNLLFYILEYMYYTKSIIYYNLFFLNNFIIFILTKILKYCTF